jgi:hypothetical protein
MKGLHQQLYPTTQELHCEMTMVININQTRNAFLSNWNHSAPKGKIITIPSAVITNTILIYNFNDSIDEDYFLL